MLMVRSDSHLPHTRMPHATAHLQIEMARGQAEGSVACQAIVVVERAYDLGLHFQLRKRRRNRKVTVTQDKRKGKVAVTQG